VSFTFIPNYFTNNLLILCFFSFEVSSYKKLKKKLTLEPIFRVEMSQKSQLQPQLQQQNTQSQLQSTNKVTKNKNPIFNNSLYSFSNKKA
jgi:hypothetical protein